MATDRQIEANRKNSALSGGPRTASGKSRSRLNAAGDNLAGESPAVEAEFSPEFEERRACWTAEHAPSDEKARWALDRAVAASLQIERCERAIEGQIADARRRAELAWDEDRLAEAAVLFSRLAKEPVVAATKLRTTLAGAELLTEAWLGLASALQDGRDWTEAETSMALDLLGVAPALRSARNSIDPTDEADPVAFRLEIAKVEVGRLEMLREQALVPLEEVDRRRALAGDLALLSKPVQRLLRYERDAWRRYRESIEQMKAKAYATPVVGPAPPVIAPPKKSPEPPSSPPKPSFEEERRALLAEVAPIRDAMIEELVALGFEDEDAWIAELERRSSQFAGGFVPVAAGRPATERTQFRAVAVG